MATNKASAQKTVEAPKPDDSQKTNTQLAAEALERGRVPPSQETGPNADRPKPGEPYQPIKSDLPAHMQGERSVESILNPELTDANHRNARVTHPDWAPGRLPDGVTLGRGNDAEKVAQDVPVPNPGDKAGGEPLGRNEPGEH